MENGKIHLEIRPEVSEIDNAAGINVGGNIVPGFRTRGAQVTVQIEDGQTLCNRRPHPEHRQRHHQPRAVPGRSALRRCRLFVEGLHENEQELIILVTPRLVHPVDCCKIPKYLPGRDTRSPDDFEFFLEGIMEAPRGQRNTVFHPHLYKPAFHGAPNAGQVPCNDGNCYGRTGCATGNCAPGYKPPCAMPSVPAAPVVALPMPSFPEVPALPASNSRIIVESEIPGTYPPLRDAGPPSLGPVTPTIPGVPMPPARQQDPRPVLPPFNPAGR